MDNYEQSRFQKIILDLEKRCPYFKKMDIYSAVSNASKKIQSFLSPVTDKEFEDVKPILGNNGL